MYLFSSTNMKNKRERLNCRPTWHGRLPRTSLSVFISKVFDDLAKFLGSWMEINDLSPYVSCPVRLCFSNPK